MLISKVMLKAHLSWLRVSMKLPTVRIKGNGFIFRYAMMIFDSHCYLIDEKIEYIQYHLIRHQNWLNLLLMSALTWSAVLSELDPIIITICARRSLRILSLSFSLLFSSIILSCSYSNSSILGIMLSYYFNLFLYLYTSSKADDSFCYFSCFRLICCFFNAL